jgi:hypothetical protein
MRPVKLSVRKVGQMGDNKRHLDLDLGRQGERKNSSRRRGRKKLCGSALRRTRRRKRASTREGRGKNRKIGGAIWGDFIGRCFGSTKVIWDFE